MYCPAHRSLSGFTLLEVLVALALLATAYAVILQVFGGAARAAGRAEEYREALMVAETRLNIAASSAGTIAAQDSGVVAGKYRWHVTTEHAEFEQVAGYYNLHVPIQVTVVVSWGAGATKQVSLSTLRVVRRGRG